jgi:WS/DGAT/MGAT family acyltransferase
MLLTISPTKGMGMPATDRFERAARPGSRMMPTDALFWYAEEATPELRPLVAAIMILDRPPDHDRLQALLERWIVRIPRLRQRVVEAPLRLGLPEWEDDPHFELGYHARDVVLPEPGTEQHLFEFASVVFATPLDHMRPLWEAYLIEGLQGGRAACFFKVHHTVMDGVASMAGFDALTQGHRAEPVRVPRMVPMHPPRPPAVRVARLVRDLLWNAADGIGAAVGLGVQAVLHPGEAGDGVVRTVRGLRGLLRDLAAPPVHDPLADPTTGLGRRLDGLTLPLPRLRRIKDALGVTLNDVVLTAVAGAVGRYHDHRGVHVDELHCMVPIDLRQEHERYALGNRVGMCNIALPVGEADPLVRLELIRAQMNAAKADRRGAAYPLVMRALAFMPSFAFRLLAQAVTGRINLICTNVPGPPTVRFLAGAKIEVMYPFAPVAVGTPLSVALLSYGAVYGIGIDTDPAAIPDPELLRRYLVAEFDGLERRARLQLPPPVKTRTDRAPRKHHHARRHRAAS